MKPSLRTILRLTALAFAVAWWRFCYPVNEVRHSSRRTPPPRLTRLPMPLTPICRNAFSTGMTLCIRRITRTSLASRLNCGMALVPMYESKTPAEQASADAGLIHMPQSQQRALGVRLTTVQENSVSRTLRTSGVVAADETRIAHVHVKTAGWVEEVYANFVGQLVHKGQALFTVYSPDIVATQQEYLIARRGQQQLGGSQYDEVAKSSQSLMESARERLKLWDLTDKQIANLDRTGEVSKTITVYSPVSGSLPIAKRTPILRPQETWIYTPSPTSRAYG